MTVSNVVNGKRGRVSQATVDRVLAIVDARGYVPNASARSLAAQRSRIVGVLVPVAEGDALTMSPHHVAVIGGVERQLRRHGYHVLLRGIDEPREVGEAVRAWDLDGAVLLGFLDEEIDALPEHGVPLLAIDSYSENPRASGVRSDDFAGGRLAARHLIERGHTRILFAGPEAGPTGVVRRRLDGFLQAFADAGIRHDPALRAVTVTTHEAGRELGVRLRERHGDTTAVFATADILAIGIMEGLAESGLAVPGDVSVIGFDNLDLGAYVTPKLTTVAQDLGEKVAVAARMLLGEIDGELRTPDEVTLPVRIEERASVRALGEPPAGAPPAGAPPAEGDGGAPPA